MSLYSYQKSKEISAKGYPFDSLIMAAFRKSDTNNTEKLKQAFPEIWEEIYTRYNAPGGLLAGEEPNSE